MSTLEAIIPKLKIFDSRALEQELRFAIDATLKVVNADYRAVTRTWKRKPVFKTTLAHKAGPDLVGSVWTDDEIYGYVTEGTRPHVIRPKHGRSLRFKTGYRAKTTPRVIGSHAGGASGPTAFAEVVHHPGTAAREFEDEIAKRRQKTLETFVTAALLRVAEH